MKNTKTSTMVTYALLIAIIVIMGFTPLGYLKVGAIEITFITIPVIIGAITMGPACGAVLGATFGITSFIQCFGMSPFGSALLGINPILTFILCVVPRTLMGWLCGIIFKAIKNKSGFLVASLSGALLNTIFFVLGLVLMFGRTEYITTMIDSLGGGNIFAFLVAFVGINGLIEAAVCAVLGTAIAAGVYKGIKK